MDPSPTAYNPHSIETEVLALWKARRLPPAGGTLGPAVGPTVRQFAGGWTQGDFPALVAHRAVTADVDARYLGLVGRRTAGTLRQATGPTALSTVPALLTALGVWTGGDGRFPWDSEDRTAGVQTMVGRLAGKGILVTRDESFRVCPSCGTTRGPERTVYDEEEGDTYLVRFPVRFEEWAVNALVWVDSPWKLLGASALLVNPDLKYVVAGYRRREERELVFTSASSLARLRSWIPDATLEIVTERLGREFQGLAYTYPLRHEFPMGGDLPAPAGTILGAPDVGESGTGIVPLVPGHGPTDARIANRIGVSGWPLLTSKGMLDVTLMHKYTGLDLDTANEFVVRDLSEAGALLARLRVKRGVPHCAVCGTPLLWAPGRAWCLELSRLPPEYRAMFSRLLPREALPGSTEVAPWPVSESTVSEDAVSVALLECVQCDRLEGPNGPKQCPCGGHRTVVRRRLLPSSGAALAAWARFDPFPEGDSARVYVGHRRRVPALVNHLVALSGIEGSVPEVTLAVVPTVAAADAVELVATHGADAVRAAMVRGGLGESTGVHFTDRCRREADRLRRWWLLSREVAAKCDPAALSAFARPIGGSLAELEVEDRAIVARWERTRVLALSYYDQWSPALVHRVVSRFLDNDLIEYRQLVQPRLALEGTPPTKRSAVRTLVHLLRGLSEVLAPIAPFTSEAVHRALSTERTSVFERPMTGLDRSLVNDELVAAWGRWQTVLRSVDRFRRSLGVAPSTVLPSIVLVLAADDMGDRFRAEKETLARLARAQRLEVGSPREPWTGRQRVLRPVESEIQKVYPTEASQIIHLLQRMPTRRWEAAAGQGELDLVINGLPRRVFASMVAITNTLPERVVPFPWSLGDMFLELPTGAGDSRPPPPPLSSDAFWLVRRVERRLRSSPPAEGRPPRVAIVTVKDPLASELRAIAGAVSRYLGLAELRVVEKSEEAVPPNALTGRTRTGDRWWVHVPDLPTRAVREKHPCPGARLQRVPVPTTCVASDAVDYADEKVVAHEEAVRALGQELDDLVGIPLLGPAKIAFAWEHGLHSVDDLRHLPFETVSALPGFGGPVAEVVITKLGGSVPARAARRLRERAIARPSVPGPPAPAGLPTPAPEVPPAAALPVVEREAPSPPPPGPPELAAPPPSDLVSAPPATEEAGAAPELPPPPIPTREEVNVEAPPPTEEPTRSEESREPAPPVEPEPAPPEPTPEPALVAPEPSIGPVEGPGLDAMTLLTGPLPPEGEQPPAEDAATLPSPETEPEVEVPEPVAETPTESVPSEPESEKPSETEPAPSEPTEDRVVVEEPSIAPESPAEEPLPAETVEPTTPSVTTPAAEEATSPPESTETAVTEPEGVPERPPLDVTPPTPPPEVEPRPEPAPEPEEVVSAPLATEEAGAAPELPPPPIPTREEVNAEAPPPTEEPRPSEESGEPVEPEPAAPEPTPEPEEVVAPPAPIAAPGPEEIVTPPPLEPVTPVVAAVASPPPPIPGPAEPEPPSPPSGVELTVGDTLTNALGGFLDSTAAGHHGVCVVRESPERIRVRVGSRPIEVLWLTNIGRGPSLRPADLEGVWAFLSRKLLEERVTAFFLEGIEYLVRLHGADAVLTGLVQFDRLARENDARIWVYLAPQLMKPADLDRFRSTFGRGSAPS